MHCDAILNTLLCALPLMTVGILAGSDFRKRESGVWLRKSIVYLIVFFAELTIAYVLSPDKVHFEYLVTTPVVTYYLLCWLLSLRCNLSDNVGLALRNSSTWIYCVHPLIILLYDRYSGVTGIRRFLIICIILLVTSSIYAVFKNQKGKSICE